MSNRAIRTPRGPRSGLRWLSLLTLLLLSIATTQVGCISSVFPRSSVAYIEPPAEPARASWESTPLKASDALRFTLLDDSGATAQYTCQVAPDGTIEVPGSGRIVVAGRTMDAARQAVQETLAASPAMQQLVEIERSDYFLVTLAVNQPKNVRSIPLHGSVRVKDALANLPQAAGKTIWIARPLHGPSVKKQILAVDREGIARGEDATNYTLQAGDSLCLAEKPEEGSAWPFGGKSSGSMAAEQPSLSNNEASTDSNRFLLKMFSKMTLSP
jgi:hypothetical protein